MSAADTGVLGLDEWAEFNRRKWHVTPEQITVGNGQDGGPRLEAVLFRNRAGRICLPNRNPYIALRFTPTALNAVRVDRQWLDLGSQLADTMGRAGLATAVSFPPGVVDIRPWRWAGFQVSVKYTSCLDFPLDLSLADQSVRRRLRKVEKEGGFIERTSDLISVHQCLMETEELKGFRHQLSLTDLEMARDLLGEERFRPYLYRNREREAVCACVALHRPGSRAIFWVGGYRVAHRKSGVDPLLKVAVAQDLEAAGATGFDLAGANIPTVATAKANLGARLMPYYTIEGFGLKSMARWVRGWWQFSRSRTRTESPKEAEAPC